MKNEFGLEKREEDYRKGKILDSENKEFAIKLLIKFMKDFQKKYNKAKKQVKKMKFS